MTRAPWNEPRGYRTLGEREQDEKRLLVSAMKNLNGEAGDPLDVTPRKWDGTPQAHRAFTVSPEDLRRARREDALMFLSIGGFIGAGIGFIVGVLVATR